MFSVESGVNLFLIGITAISVKSGDVIIVG